MGKSYSESDVINALTEALESPVQKVSSNRSGGAVPDLVLRSGNQLFLVELRIESSANQVGSAIQRLRNMGGGGNRELPLLVVPYMGEVGKQLCQAELVSWLDLSGNANLTAPGLRVRLEGKPNRYKRSGRPSNLFSATRSRLARLLLTNPGRAYTQQELAEESELDRGTVSKLIKSYEQAGLVTRTGWGRGSTLGVTDDALLLDTWYSVYEFKEPSLRQGHIAARSGPELTRRLAAEFVRSGTEYAFTGLAGAWLIEPFAAFRLVTVYVRDWPPKELLESFGFHEEARGSNVWLVRPKDEGVFQGSQEHDGIRSVSPVQAYLDLKSQPERAEEAAEELRRRLIRSSP